MEGFASGGIVVYTCCPDLFLVWRVLLVLLFILCYILWRVLSAESIVVIYLEVLLFCSCCLQLLLRVYIIGKIVPQSTLTVGQCYGHPLWLPMCVADLSLTVYWSRGPPSCCYGCRNILLASPCVVAECVEGAAASIALL
jgi:hypothetical protein